MNLVERKIRQSNRDRTLMLMVPVAILGKLIQIFILPDKYFYDSWRMALMMQGETSQGWWSGYERTINIFSKVNIFGFTTSRQWSIMLGILFTIMLIILVSRVKEMSMSECIYTLMATGLMNIYVFNLAKEPIQMTYFLFIMLIIVSPIKNTFIKIIACCGIYYWEANTFREYYIIMAVMALVLYFIFLWLKSRKKEINKKYIIVAIILCFLAMFVFVYASQFVDKEAYDDALIVRDEYDNEGANSVINNPIEVSGNYVNFMIDYVINAIRMMFPLELLIKSPVYAPFVIYQIFILVYWIRAMKNIRRLNNEIMLALVCFTAYLFGSFVFEPDFGSWVRHEAAAFPIFYILAFENLGENNRDRETAKQNTNGYKEYTYETENA